MSIIPFEHKMAAHCETGAMTALLNHAGLHLSEPLIFGISGGIFFAYFRPAALQFPTLITRSMPGVIRKKIAKRVGVKFHSSKYRDPIKAQSDLDGFLEKNIPTAVQLDVFYMDYVPLYMKIHFNAHFVIILGKENNRYTVSDCYQPAIQTVAEGSIAKGRFARGDLAPHGLSFNVVHAPKNPDLKKAIIAGIKESCKNMVKLPIPFLGVKGIRLFAKKLPLYPELMSDIEVLSHETMQINVILEEQGTGGAGFRFMFATFLQEAAQILRHDDLYDMAKRMMEIGDKWREISLFAARVGKKRDLGVEKFKELSAMVVERADEEEKFFKQLSKLV
jgi:hypothetical protein